LNRNIAGTFQKRQTPATKEVYISKNRKQGKKEKKERNNLDRTARHQQLRHSFATVAGIDEGIMHLIPGQHPGILVHPFQAERIPGIEDFIKELTSLIASVPELEAQATEARVTISHRPDQTSQAHTEARVGLGDRDRSDESRHERLREKGQSGREVSRSYPG
jgi:hypothetical protein